MEFIGRTKELVALSAAYDLPKSGLWPVYGRRRIGKTELIKRFLAGRPGVYFLGKQAPAPMQIQEFLRAAAVALDEPLLATQVVEGWPQALASVVDRWRGPGKLVLVMDEFQWSAAASPELPSVIQGLWDSSWRDQNKVLLILCGSFIGFMEREVLGRESPLFGRRTGQIHLQPFGYREAAAFHPRCSRRDQALTYFVCGGVPLYLRAFSEAQSVEDNIASQLLDPYAPLHREPDFLLREELREVERYYGILLAVATGDNTPPTIAARTGIDIRQLSYYLQQLLDLGYVRRRQPLTPQGPRRRDLHYAIADPLLRFWFRFLFPQLSTIVRVGPQRASREVIRPELPAYWDLCFESLCQEALPEILAREGSTAHVEVGEYWDAKMQIDLAGLRDDGRIELGECKWGVVRSGRAVLDELTCKAERYPNPNNASLSLRIFTSGNVKAAAEGKFPVQWATLADLYG
jgi:AAA+ ATPase superfamily predicted ATPase